MQSLVKIQPLTIAKIQLTDLETFLTAADLKTVLSLPESYQLDIIDTQSDLTLIKVHEDPKIFQCDKKTCERYVCAFLVMFNETTTAKYKMNPVQIYDFAKLFVATYTHESISDLLLCLKLAKLGQYGNDYHRIDSTTLLGYFTQYLEQKSELLEFAATSLTTQTFGGGLNTWENSSHLHQERQQQIREGKAAEKTATTFFNEFQKLQDGTNQS